MADETELLNRLDTYKTILKTEFIKDDFNAPIFKKGTKVVDSKLNITWNISIRRFFKCYLSDSLDLFVEPTTQLQDLRIIQYNFKAFEDKMELLCSRNHLNGDWDTSIENFKLSAHITQIKHNSNWKKIEIEIAIILQEKPNLSIDYGKMLQDTSFSDIKIKCEMDGKEFTAHKLILAARSPVFHAMFLSNLKETQSNLVEISDIDSETMEILLTYIYSGKIITNPKNWFNLYVAADKYQMENLMNYCIRYLMANISMATVIDGLKIDEYFNKTQLATKIYEFIASLNPEMKNLLESKDWEDFCRDYPHREKLLCEKVVMLKVEEKTKLLKLYINK